MERTITIKDNLNEIVESVCDEVKDLLIAHLVENPDLDEAPDLSDLDYSGDVHMAVDSSIPIYTNEIRSLWFLYEDEFISAYGDAGCGDNPKENDGKAAIYFYIEQQVYEWYSDNVKDIFDEWRSLHCACGADIASSESECVKCGGGES
jgi:hypothetical protein